MALIPMKFVNYRFATIDELKERIAKLQQLLAEKEAEQQVNPPDILSIQEKPRETVR